MQTIQSVRKKRRFFNTDPLEINPQRRSNFVVDQVKSQTEGMMHKFWEQVLGASKPENTFSQQGDMTEGQAIFLSKQTQVEEFQEEARPTIRAAYDYAEEIRNIGKSDKREQHEMQSKITELIGELRQLATASAFLEKEVIEASGQTIASPGKYHLTFFERLIIEVKLARMQIENASSWLTTVNTKNGKKKDYWQMYKKHGTKFGLSGERSVSTQTA